MATKLLLFDLDWTLVYTGGAGVRALNHSIEKQFGIADAMKTVSPDGKTDPLIVREMIHVHLKRDATPVEIETICRGYIERLKQEVETGPGYRIMPGIPELLQALVGHKEAVRGLGTGNLKSGAKIILARAKLDHYFDFGGFADDSEDRPKVLAAAVRRGEEKMGRTVNAREVVVIGDHRRDIEAGKAIGAVTVAVATGPMKAEELAASHPEHLFSDLSDTAAVLKVLLS